MGRFRGLFSSLSGDWQTPQGLFDELDKEFHFTLDACATWQTAKCPEFYQVDSLSKPWTGVVFCNPPYGCGIAEWVRKGYHSSLLGATVVMLLPSRTDTKSWWHPYVMKADETRFIEGRLHFLDKWGLDQGPAPFPSCVVVFRPPRR